jgi:hypothetical protein
MKIFHSDRALKNAHGTYSPCDLLPPLKRGASSSRETHTDIGTRPQDPPDGLPLLRRELGLVHLDPVGEDELGVDTEVYGHGLADELTGSVFLGDVARQVQVVPAGLSH